MAQIKMIMKAYTDLNQSKKLAKILPIESADIFYRDNGIDAKLMWEHNAQKVKYPCWSLAALLGRLPFPILYMEMVAGMILWCCECHFIETNEVVKIEHCDNPVDACYEMIIKLHKQKLL